MALLPHTPSDGWLDGYCNAIRAHYDDKDFDAAEALVDHMIAAHIPIPDGMYDIVGALTNRHM